MSNRDRPGNSTSNCELHFSSEHVTVLKPEDHAVFFDAIDNPPAPTVALRDAFVRYMERITSNHQGSEADVQSLSLDFPQTPR